MTSVSIVIVTYNAKVCAAACLRSLSEAPPAIPHDITIVDNASTDGLLQMVEADWPTVNRVDMGRNAGFAAANNAGIRASTGTCILLLNSDTIVRAGAIDTLVAALDADSGVAIAGPRIVDGDGEPELSFGRMISPVAEVRQKVLGRRTKWIARETRREQFVDWVSGACLLVRRPDAEAVGLLDERYFLYTEDVDFCAAIRARGRRVLFTPRAEIVHLRGQSRATAPQAASAAYRRSHLAFYEKHHPAWAPWLRLYLRLKRELPPT